MTMTQCQRHKRQAPRHHQRPACDRRSYRLACEEAQAQAPADVSHNICLVSSGPSPAVPLSPQVQDLLDGTLVPGVESRCFLAFGAPGFTPGST